MRAWPLIGLLLLAACDGEAPPDDTTEATDSTDAPDEEAKVTIVGSCAYINAFSQGDECKEYTGDDWTAETAAEDCQAPLIGAQPGTFTAEARCGYESELGRCVLDAGLPEEAQIVFPGDDPDACSGAEVGCGFGGGTFVPGEVCKDSAGGGGNGLPVFQPFEQTCLDPVGDEPEGDGPDGQVCTYGAISACTEEGRTYEAYGDCDAVLTQRPYVAVPPTTFGTADDPRLDDTEWMAEFAWVTEQVESCACVCCHSDQIAPNGASNWYLEADGVWLDTVDDDGLAMLAGWVDSTAFGWFDPADNNGFSRDVTGLPTTDVTRMAAFLEGELARRGLEESDFAETEPFGGPLYDQLFFEPSACTGDSGIGDDGTITWAGGRARYVYVLEADAMSPGVPPNLDTPDGTFWRLDVAYEDDAVESGSIVYGTVPDGMTQAFPEDGAPAALTPGSTVYLVALRDVYQPLTRCLATVPE